jgi:pyruvate-formate lyase-activating enzyme
METKLHILLTYNCSLRCKHCYVFSSQRAAGKISLSQISYILNEGLDLPNINGIIFGGGEPFTQYPLLLKAVQRARQRGYSVGVATNGYFARTVETGIRFLRPLAEMGVKELRVSNDYMHYLSPNKSPAKKALAAAKTLGLATTLVQVNLPGNGNLTGMGEHWATKVESRRLRFAGRAAESLTQDLPLSDWSQFNDCPRDDLRHPDQVYIDAYGYVQIGVMHIEGPAGLIRKNGLQSSLEYVEACHCCYMTRRTLIDQYPDLLGPCHVYGY